MTNIVRSQKDRNISDFCKSILFYIIYFKREWNSKIFLLPAVCWPNGYAAHGRKLQIYSTKLTGYMDLHTWIYYELSVFPLSIYDKNFELHY